ncbi:carboxymuconolactone decarboxylase family protein [Euzebyella saccharophila]|uniref:Carboxymuconolactone decarboxylase family protein n=1 Tax=Euzebyella saccharophila TaxID=679664 RepID=A0ABV8JQU5_9FLAO|nr:carboxymuconolactone decarboxylase family protein [Euzebyella saccharophila]MDO1498828.1 carboxymuconolactone decarboxylase family protein [Winogradskyella maritima]
MTKRINIYQTQPEAFKGMFALEKFLTEGPLNKKQISLIKMRASQINGCAYCLAMHSKEALKAGESPERLHLLAAWKDSNEFINDEKVLLRMTEEITNIHENGLTEETYQIATELFETSSLISIIMAIATINSWNRIAISTRLEFNSSVT